jgi:hypothetical protein
MEARSGADFDDNARAEREVSAESSGESTFLGVARPRPAICIGLLLLRRNSVDASLRMHLPAGPANLTIC